LAYGQWQMAGSEKEMTIFSQSPSAIC
jgi:hypothetical protein